MAEKNNEYMIDVAKDSTYLNQSDEYRKLYADWRADPDNLYGYQFVHDMREHTYIDGKGYVPHLAEVAESISLVKCCGMMGVALLIMFLIDLTWYLVCLGAYPEMSNYVYSSQIGNIENADFSFIMLSGLVGVARYVVPLLIFFKVTKLPKKVAFPMSTRRFDLLANSIVIMLLIMVIGRIINMFLPHIFSIFKVDTLYSVLWFSKEPRSVIAAFIFNCIAIPIVQELLFRGVFLQIFRQFGDLFAVLSTSFLCALCFYDITYYTQVTICFIVLGVITVRTGSIFTPIIMSVISHTVNFILSYTVLAGLPQAELIEIVVIVIIMGISIVAYNNLLNEKYKILTVSQARSGMRYMKKTQVMIASTSIALWISASLVMTFVIMRLL